MLVIDTEFKLAATCGKVVYGSSGIMKAILNNELAQKKKLELVRKNEKIESTKEPQVKKPNATLKDCRRPEQPQKSRGFAAAC